MNYRYCEICESCFAYIYTWCNRFHYQKKKNLQRFFHCAEQKIKGSYNWKRPTVKNDLYKFEGEDFEFKVIIQIKTELQYSHLSRKNFNLINIQYFVYCEKRFLRVKKRNWTSLLNQTIRCSENGIFGVNSRNKDNPQLAITEYVILWSSGDYKVTNFNHIGEYLTSLAWNCWIKQRCRKCNYWI